MNKRNNHENDKWTGTYLLLRYSKHSKCFFRISHVHPFRQTFMQHFLSHAYTNTPVDTTGAIWDSVSFSRAARHQTTNFEITR